MSPSAPRGVVDAVIKVGGALIHQPSALDDAAHAIAAAARTHRVLVVPGGGPFADAVRTADRDVGLGDDAAHWMAILGMEQYAHLLAERIAGARIVECVEEIERAYGDACVPVLAPYRWLRSADPLPHAWEVTSDSIAAWVAGAVNARTLVLIKPVADETRALVDAYFGRAVPEHLRVEVLSASDVGALGSTLG